MKDLSKKYNKIFRKKYYFIFYSFLKPFLIISLFMSSFFSSVLFIRLNCPYFFQSFPIPLLYPYLLVSNVHLIFS
jgi:hypothetical protein